MSSTLKDITQQIGTPKLADLPGNVKKAVSELDRKNYGKLTYEYIDPETGSKKLEALARKYDLLTLKWPDIPDKGKNRGEKRSVCAPPVFFISAVLACQRKHPTESHDDPAAKDREKIRQP